MHYLSQVYTIFAKQTDFMVQALVNAIAEHACMSSAHLVFAKEATLKCLLGDF